MSGNKIMKPVSVIDPFGEYEGAFVIVETDGADVYIGVLSYPTRDTVKINTGMTGRPKVLSAYDVDLITSAINHPDVVAA